MSSVRRRIFWGALFWTLGLFIGSVLVVTILMLRNREWPIVMHGSAAAHAPFWWIVLAVLMAAGLIQMRRAFTPLDELRTRLGGVRAGRASRIEGAYPSEVQPLVDDLNGLLDHQERAVRRAVAKAGDLAHGLKTPLAVLAHEADRAHSAGQHELAQGLREQIERMQRQVDYHLAHARAAASGAVPGATTSVRASVDGLVRTLERLHAGRGVRFDVDVDPHCQVRVQREDLDEMLGNLLDNACKWRRLHVSVAAHAEPSAVAIVVDDDGPGVPEGMRDRVVQRGVRADEAAPGTGFGLAIVRELAELYGGELRLAAGPEGGLRAVLRLPAAPADPGVRA